MSGLFKRLSSRRSGGPEGTEPPAAAQPGTTDAPASTPAEAKGHRPLFTDPAAQSTRVLREGEQPTGLGSGGPLALDNTLYGAPIARAPLADPGPAAADPNAPAPFIYPSPAAYVPPPSEPVADLPAGLDPDELGAAPGTSARRGKLRRRAAFLRAARELLLRDLGGFAYELHRTAHDIEHEAHRRLRETKLARLERVDAELHEIEVRLDDVRRQVLVREPGVGGECPHCGELFGSAAHYCSHCGNPLTEAARRELAKGQVAEPVAVAEPEPAAGADQPTQVISPPASDQPSPEFEWPRRESRSAEAGAPAEAAPAADETPVGEGDSAEAGQDETATGDATPADDATPVGDGAAPTADETPAPVTDGDPVADSVDPAEDADDSAPVGDGDVAPGDGEPHAEEPPADGDTPSLASDAPTRDYETWRGQSANGHDDSILRPAERRP